MVAATGVIVHGTGSGVLGTTILTAFTDNAALTYLGSLVEGLSDAFKYAPGSRRRHRWGLTIIANAPNPAGAAILRPHLENRPYIRFDCFWLHCLPRSPQPCGSGFPDGAQCHSDHTPLLFLYKRLC